MTFDATKSKAPGGLAEFSWQFNAVANADTVEQTTPTIGYTFPAPGAYSTGVAVFNSDGLSAGTGGIVVTGKNGFQPAFTASPGPGTTVNFSALTTVSGKPVINYLWEFGDGTSGSGPTPTHTYQRSGSYTVTAVLFSGVGSAFPGDGAAPIYQQKDRGRCTPLVELTDTYGRHSYLRWRVRQGSSVGLGSRAHAQRCGKQRRAGSVERADVPLRRSDVGAAATRLIRPASRNCIQGPPAGATEGGTSGARAPPTAPKDGATRKTACLGASTWAV
jgi:plastocyanin